MVSIRPTVDKPPEKPVDKKKEDKKAPPPKITVPDFSEWEDFIGDIVLRWAARAFIAVVFRGIDRYEVCSQEELDDMELDDEELQAVSRPFAKLITRSKLNEKYGRTIMDSKDAIEAAVVLFMWSQRVRRIAKHYRPKHVKTGKHEREINNGQRGGESISEAEGASPYPVFGGNFHPNGHGYN